MIKKKMLDAMNEQMRHEFQSANIYLAMSAYFESKNLPGFAHWMLLQYQEEVAHAMKFFQHMVDRGERPVVPGLDKPAEEFSSPLDVFEKALAHEEFITSRINELYDFAVSENDRPAQVLLQWFIEEQVEEENNVGSVVDMLKLAGDAGHALLMIDQQLAGRQEGSEE